MIKIIKKNIFTLHYKKIEYIKDKIEMMLFEI